MSDEVRYLRSLIASQRIDIDRLQDRMEQIESVIFALSPSQFDENIDTVEAVRIFLKKANFDALTPNVVRFIEDRLTVDWRDLIRRKGFRKVFQLLANGQSIIEARKVLA